MVNNMTTNFKEEMTFDWQHISPVALDIEEAEQGVAIIKGTLLSEGVTGNGHLYTLDEMESIARQAEGVDIYYGTMTKFEESVGMYVKNAHADVDENKVGKIMKTLFDRAARKITFIAQILNTDKFPDLINKVKKGWGISVGGKGKGRFILDSLGRLVTKVCGMQVNHVSLLDPNTPRGQQSAQVESEPITQEFQESMVIYELPQSKIITVVEGIGCHTS